MDEIERIIVEHGFVLMDEEGRYINLDGLAIPEPTFYCSSRSDQVTDGERAVAAYHNRHPDRPVYAWKVECYRMV